MPNRIIIISFLVDFSAFQNGITQAYLPSGQAYWHVLSMFIYAVTTIIYRTS